VDAESLADDEQRSVGGIVGRQDFGGDLLSRC
jgi:hypothetical protein